MAGEHTSEHILQIGNERVRDTVLTVLYAISTLGGIALLMYLILV